MLSRFALAAVAFGLLAAPAGAVTFKDRAQADITQRYTPKSPFSEKVKNKDVYKLPCTPGTSFTYGNLGPPSYHKFKRDNCNGVVTVID